MRAWARENGYDVADRGRLRPEVLEAFAAAHRSTTSKKTGPKPATRKAPARKAAAKPAPEPEAVPAPSSPEPKPKPVTDDRRLVALGEELAALTERVAQLEAQLGSRNGKPSSRTPRFRRSR